MYSQTPASSISRSLHADDGPALASGEIVGTRWAKARIWRPWIIGSRLRPSAPGGISAWQCIQRVAEVLISSLQNGQARFLVAGSAITESYGKRDRERSDTRHANSQGRLCHPGGFSTY